jgi:Ca-activated chloride channel homolog
MKFLATLAVSPCLALGLLAAAHADTGDADDTEKSLSPYFFVKSDDPATDHLPLKATDVNVAITGVIADVTVKQRYKNEGKKPLEARYVFPASTHAAVYGMQMHIGERVIEAKIREKQQAKIEYENAKTQGKSASLLEQERPNVFQMNVANILPGEEIAVELHYTETIVPREGKYQFVYPTVVGPRYNGPLQSGSGKNEAWIQTPYFQPKDQPNAIFALDLKLAAPIALQEINSASHAINISKPDGYHAALHLPPSSTNGNRDFILNYSLAGDAIQTGTLLYKDAEENFFMTMIEPPKRIANTEIVPRDYVFIVDISGSMNGFPLDTAKALLRKLAANLNPADTFNVLLFAGSDSLLSPRSLPATKENIEKAIAVIDQQEGGGSTELLPALRHALTLEKTDNRSRNFVVITDGYVTVEKEAFELIRNNLNKANVFAFGIGSSVNRLLMEGLARAGKGEAFVVTNENDADNISEQFRQYIQSPVWTHLDLQIEGLDAYDILPVRLPDLFAERPVVITGKWRGKPSGEIKVSGRTTGGEITQAVTIDDDIVADNAYALRYLWARERIAEISDYSQLLNGGNDREIKELTALGLKYNLLTDYTSFIAVDHVVRTNEKGETVDQPNALPEGVSELAVGAEVPSTPEPEFYAMMAMAGLMGAWLRRRSNVRGS